MFNLGNDDKEKLKENMEEIKNLVNNEGSDEVQDQEEAAHQGGKPDFSQMNQEAAETSSSPKQAVDQQANSGTQEGFSSGNTTSNQNSQDLGQDQNNNCSSQSQGQSRNLGQKNVGGESFSSGNQNNQQSAEQQGSGNVERDAQNNLESSTESGEGFSNDRSSRFTDNQSSNSGESTQLDRNSGSQSSNSPGRQPPQSADFSKGKEDAETIFLTVDHFDQLQDRIEEMRYLSNEIGDVVDHLEAGVSEDERTENEAQQLLEDFSDRRGEVEEIVSSQEE